MKTKLTYILIIILAFTYSCHKYDENTLLLKKPEKVFFGHKKISSYYIDGVDNTNKINQKVNYIEFTEVPHQDILYGIGIILNDTDLFGSKLIDGVWGLTYHKKRLRINQYDTDSFVPTDSIVEFFLFKSCIWDITRLKPEIIKLETDGYNLHHHYQLELIPE